MKHNIVSVALVVLTALGCMAVWNATIAGCTTVSAFMGVVVGGPGLGGDVVGHSRQPLTQYSMQYSYAIVRDTAMLLAGQGAWIEKAGESSSDSSSGS